MWPTPALNEAADAHVRRWPHAGPGARAATRRDNKDTAASLAQRAGRTRALMGGTDE